MWHHLVALDQNSSNSGRSVESGPMLWVLGHLKEIKKEIFKNHLVLNPKGKPFHIWLVASSSGPHLKYFK